MVWYSHLFQNFPQCIVIHTVKGFGIVNKAEIEVYWTPPIGCPKLPTGPLQLDVLWVPQNVPTELDIWPPACLPHPFLTGSSTSIPDLG